MKKYVIYFIVAFFWGMLLQVLVDLFRGMEFENLLTKSNIPGLCLAGLIFAILMTLLKYFEQRKGLKK